MQAALNAHVDLLVPQCYTGSNHGTCSSYVGWLVHGLQ